MEVDIKIPERVTIEADDNQVTITRKGLRSFANRGKNGSQSIPYSSIIGINYKEAGFIGGQLELVTAAGEQRTGGMGAFGGFAGGAYNKANSVVFRPTANDDMDKLKKFIDEKVALARKSNDSQISDADELSKFKKLLDDGVITQEEFEAKKKQLLGL